MLHQHWLAIQEVNVFQKEIMFSQDVFVIDWSLGLALLGRLPGRAIEVGIGDQQVLEPILEQVLWQRLTLLALPPDDKAGLLEVLTPLCKDFFHVVNPGGLRENLGLFKATSKSEVLANRFGFDGPCLGALTGSMR